MKLNKVIAIPAIAIAAGIGLAACGSQTVSHVGSSPSSSAPAAAHSAKPAAATQPPSSGNVGNTLNAQYNADNINITLVKVIDPAQGADQYTTPNTGMRFVGAVFTIKANAAYNDDANSDASLNGSNGQVYSPDFNDIAGYTNFNDGKVALAAGGSATGVVVFQVPAGVNIKTIQYDLSSGYATGSVPTWNVSS